MSTFQILLSSYLLADGQGQHQRGVLCPKLFSGPAWVTGILALSTGGGTTQVSPASSGAGATIMDGATLERVRAWALVSARRLPHLVKPRYPLTNSRPALHKL